MRPNSAAAQGRDKPNTHMEAGGLYTPVIVGQCDVDHGPRHDGAIDDLHIMKPGDLFRQKSRPTPGWKALRRTIGRCLSPCIPRIADLHGKRVPSAGAICIAEKFGICGVIYRRRMTERRWHAYCVVEPIIGVPNSDPNTPLHSHTAWHEAGMSAFASEPRWTNMEALQGCAHPFEIVKLPPAMSAMPTLSSRAALPQSCTAFSAWGKLSSSQFRIT